MRHAQEAGIPIKLASTIGIAVDHRRTNRSLEGLQVSYCTGQQQHGQQQHGQQQQQQPYGRQDGASACGTGWQHAERDGSMQMAALVFLLAA